MIYKTLWSITDIDRTRWGMSRDGGVTTVIVETAPSDGPPSDILCARLQKEQNPAPVKQTVETKPGDFADIMRQNAANKERERKERLKGNKQTLASDRIKPPSKD